MRLLIVGQLDGPIGTAGRMATQRGAKVAHIDGIENALNALRNGHGADLVMCDVALNIVLYRQPEVRAHKHTCRSLWHRSDATAAVRAIRAGAKEYIPLPPDADLIAAVLQAVAEEDQTLSPAILR